MSIVEEDHRRVQDGLHRESGEGHLMTHRSKVLELTHFVRTFMSMMIPLAQRPTESYLDMFSLDEDLAPKGPPDSNAFLKVDESIAALLGVSFASLQPRHTQDCAKLRKLLEGTRASQRFHSASSIYTSYMSDQWHFCLPASDLLLL